MGMTLIGQIFHGSGLLVVSALIHVVILAGSIRFTVFVGERLDGTRRWLHDNAILAVGVLCMVLAHAFEIWIWALAFIWTGAIEGLETAFYFALVTYTTLGYGDITLEPGVRIFATFAAITGLLCFGISTAFLLGVIVRLFPNIPTGPR
ncbi:ion channel [Epibacterium ulvae]|uniref:ion channel n=1 Tax=Epibacterium ulvae TaxID=1156985 RepID=UPI00203C529E|nr:ion channel [Epibacterium ulvae]